MDKINFLTVATALVLLFSCKDSNDTVEPVNKEPHAAITVEGGSTKLWNEVAITVQASDDDGTIASVELYANGQWIGSDAGAPYEFKWQTQDFDDGTVELKAVVKDDLDATTEVTQTVEVLNTLVDFDLNDGFLTLSPNYKTFTYVTSKSKEVLYFDQIESLPYKSKVLRSEDFNDGEFDVHFVNINGSGAELTSYDDITPGLFAPVDSDKRGAAKGQTSMTFTDIPEHDYFTFGNNLGSTLKTATSYKVNLYENLDLGYLYIRNGETGLYKIITSLKDGDMETSLSATGFEMQKHALTINEDLDEATFSVFGNISAEADAPFVNLFRHHKSGGMAEYAVKFHTPDNETVFDHYSSMLELIYADGKSYLNESYFDIISEPFKLNVALNTDGYTLSDINLTASGDPFDYLCSHFIVSQVDFDFHWTNYSKDGDIEFPAIPSDLTKAFPKFTNANLVFKDAKVYLQAVDYDNYEGYEDYLATLAGRTGKSLKEGGTYLHSVSQLFIP